MTSVLYFSLKNHSTLVRTLLQKLEGKHAVRVKKYTTSCVSPVSNLFVTFPLGEFLSVFVHGFSLQQVKITLLHKLLIHFKSYV